MRTFPHHPLRIALLALLVLQFGALASAQAPLSLEDAEATMERLSATLLAAGFEWDICRGTSSLVRCHRDYKVGFDGPQKRSVVENAMLAEGVDLATVEWTQDPEDPHTFLAKWKVPGGEFNISAWRGTSVDIFFRPDDACAEWADIDVFEFATTTGGGYDGVPVDTEAIHECHGFDQQDEFGQTPLIYAITAGNTLGVMSIVHYSDPNHRTLAGWTPLMYAVREGVGIEELLIAGADKDARAPDGTSVASLAAANPNLDAATRAALLPPPAIDARSRQIAEDFVRQNDEISGAMIEYQREIACGLLPDRPTECFVVTRSRPLAMVLDGAMYARVGVVIIATFHDGLDLNDRYGTYRAVQLMEDAPEGRQCVRRFRVPDEANIDWTVRADGTLHLHATSGPLRPHGDDRTPPPGAQALGPLCD